jgi:hypothetical protein
MATHIDLNDDHELLVWARTFGITPQELLRVASEVGPTIERVREALKRSEIGRSAGRHPPGKPA